MPAVKSAPIEDSDRIPNRISSSEGGISIPSTEEPATTPTEKRGV